jgi:TRAP-type mannitol/chloroaromatic compound transport system substrate-binding protein
MFRTACVEANLSMLSLYDKRNAEALQRLIKGTTELAYYGDPILNAARAASDQLFADLGGRDASFRSLHDQWRGFRSQVQQWNRINELSYASFAFPSGQP